MRLCLTLCVLPLFSANATGPGRFFFSVAATEDQAYAWAVPDCVAMTAQRFAELQERNACKKAAPKSRNLECQDENQVSVTNVNTNEVKRVPLTHFVFPSMKQCKQEREKYLNSLNE